MSSDWTNFWPEILVHIDRDAPDPLGVQLHNALRDAVRDGRIRYGESLPPSRRLAADLGLSRGLVQSAYSQLEAEGYLQGYPGSGTRVAFAPQPDVQPRERVAAEKTFEFNFIPGRPDLNSFPFRDWAWALNEARRVTPGRDLGYGDAGGAAPLREAVASYLRRARGVATTADRVIVCGGFTQGIAVVLASLKKTGVITVGIEDPGHPDMAHFVRRAGLVPTYVRVDDQGLVVSELAKSSATAVIVTPAHQTPKGVVLDPRRRRTLLEWADRVDGYVIEDDYDSEFRYDKAGVGALQGLAPDRVVYLGSVSKTLAPAIRLGWVLPPRNLHGRITEEKRWADRGSPVLDQIALAALLESGKFERHLRRMRSIYSARRDALVTAIRRFTPGLELSGLAAGFHAMALFSAGIDEEQIVIAAAQRSVGLHTLGHYASPGGAGQHGLVIGFGDIRRENIGRGIAIVGELIRSYNS